MKQIRTGIFETNSSTTHCLVVSRDRITKENIEKFKKENGNYIIFGKMPYSEVDKILWKEPVIDESTDFQTKADLLYFSMYVWTDCTDVLTFLHRRKMLTEKLNELGFTVEYKEDPELLNNDGGYNNNKYDAGDENMFDKMWWNIDEVINYLFNDHVLYYSWCDECCQECPKEIDEALHRFSTYEKTNNEEFEVHHYR